MSKLLKYVIQIYWGLVRTDRSKIQHRAHKNEKTKKKKTLQVKSWENSIFPFIMVHLLLAMSHKLCN